MIAALHNQDLSKVMQLVEKGWNFRLEAEYHKKANYCTELSHGIIYFRDFNGVLEFLLRRSKSSQFYHEVHKFFEGVKSDTEIPVAFLDEFEAKLKKWEQLIHARKHQFEIRD